MALTVQVGDCLQFNLSFNAAEDLATAALNVLYYRVTSVTDFASGLPAAVALPVEDVMPGLNVSIYEHFDDAWKLGASDQVQFAGVISTNVWPLDRSTPFSYAPAMPVAGVNASEPLPLQDTPTILKRTRYGTKWGLGRLFYVGLPESMQDGGFLTVGGATAVGSMADAVDDVISAHIGAYVYGLTPVLCTFERDEEGVLVDVRMTQIVRAELSNLVIKTQRRRRPGKGT